MGKKDLFRPVAKNTDEKSSSSATAANRGIRVFVSSTFRDMMEERNILMTHTWPELRRFCSERQVELVEVDLRWGIAEEQSTRNETLKLCLDEIRACRPFFVGILGERYGWIPEEKAFTADLKEEQPWLENHLGKSATELEILYGVLNNPDMAGRAFFYFRDPAYIQACGEDFQPESPEAGLKQSQLKDSIRAACAAKNIPLHENYSDPRALAALVLDQLKIAIDDLFPKESIPDPLTREARDHEAFAAIRRRTYIGRPDYFAALDRHANGEGSPLLLLGDSGSGKSALIANWVEHWRKTHPKDFIFQHYIGGTNDGAVHWKLMTRLMAEIKHWSDDSSDLPRTNDDILRDFSLWLAKGRIKAEHDGVKFIVILDALNQLEDKDHAHTLGWLPVEPFTGSLRLIVSTLPGVILAALEKRSLPTLRVDSLTSDERGRMIVVYLERFGKKLDKPRLDQLTAAPAAANPLYLKILLDELRVTGTHDELDKRLNEYLKAKDIPALLQDVLKRYQRDYEHDRKGLVSEALGLIWSSRRGLTETELLQMLRPEDLTQLQMATWSPLRAVLEESMIDRGGILNFAHDFMCTAVGTAFVSDVEKKRNLRTRLADYFEALPPTARTCDELPWLLKETASIARLRACLLQIDRFLLISKHDQEELMRYWVWLKEERTMGRAYIASFETWSSEPDREVAYLGSVAHELACFLAFTAALHAESEPLMRRALAFFESSLGPKHPFVAALLNDLGMLLMTTNQQREAEPLIRCALEINENSFGSYHDSVARDLNNLARVLYETNQLVEAEMLYRRALAIAEHNLGSEHPNITATLNNLSALLLATNRPAEAETLYRRALASDEHNLGSEHPNVARDLNNLGGLLFAANQTTEAEPLVRRALAIAEQSYGPAHPSVATDLCNLAKLLIIIGRLAEAEPLIRRALAITEQSYGPDHPNVAHILSSLAILFCSSNRQVEAEPLMRRMIKILRSFSHATGHLHPHLEEALKSYGGLLHVIGHNQEQITSKLCELAPELFDAAFTDQSESAVDLSNRAIELYNAGHLLEAEPLMQRALEIAKIRLGPNHPEVATTLSNLAQLLQATNRQAEAESLMQQALTIDESSYDPDHLNVARDLNNLSVLFMATNRLAEAEPLMRRHVEIFLKFTRVTGSAPPQLKNAINNYGGLLHAMGRTREEIMGTLAEMAPELYQR